MQHFLHNYLPNYNEVNSVQFRLEIRAEVAHSVHICLKTHNKTAYVYCT